ncbi:MAG: radical SAM protein [Elusimicrobiota bacterium]
MAVYLSDRCNEHCPYCYVSVQQRSSAALSFEQLREGLDYFLSHSRRLGRKILFMGGEPLLHYALLSRAIRHVRTHADGGLGVSLFTNGTLLSKERLEFFRSHKVDVIVHARAQGQSVPLRGHSKAGVAVNVVLLPGALPGALRRIHALYQAGFRSMSIAPDITSLWSPRDVCRLQAWLICFSSYYKGLLRRGQGFEVINIRKVMDASGKSEREGKKMRPACDSLVLAADGRFYACDKMLGAPLASLSEKNIGSPRAGLDMVGREEYFSKAWSCIRSAIGAHGSVPYCPIGVYASWEAGRFRRASGSDFEARAVGFYRVSTSLWHCWQELVKDCGDVALFRELHRIFDA